MIIDGQRVKTSQNKFILKNVDKIKTKDKYIYLATYFETGTPENLYCGNWDKNHRKSYDELLKKHPGMAGKYVFAKTIENESDAETKASSIYSDPISQVLEPLNQSIKKQKLNGGNIYNAK